MANRSESDRSLANDVIRSTSIDNFGDPWYPVDQNALESRLEGDRRCGTRHARPDEFHCDQTSFFIDIVQQHITVIGLNRRSDHFNDFLYLFTHLPSLRNDQRHAAPGPRVPVRRARLRE